MDPISAAFIAAITAGATSALQDTAKKAIADAYDGLKSLLHRNHPETPDLNTALTSLQSKPASPNYQAAVAEEVKAAAIDKDPELLASAKALLAMLQTLAPALQNTQTATGSYIVQTGPGGTSTMTIGVPPPSTPHE